MNTRAWRLALAAVVGLVGSDAFAQARRVSVGDVTLVYEDVGRGMPIVFIHGWAQDRTIWPDQVAAFSSRYRVITFDKRGFGESTGHADPTADPDDLRMLLEWWARYKGRVITNAGHGAHFDNPRQFNDALLAFFRSLDSKR